MKCFKQKYNDSTKRIEVIEFEVSREFDFSHEPETNLYDAVHSHNCDLSNAKRAIELINNDISNGDLKIEKCKDCNLYFYLPLSEINWFKYKGMNPPKRCPACRKKKKK